MKTQPFYKTQLGLFYTALVAAALIIGLYLLYNAYSGSNKYKAIDTLPPASEYNMQDPAVVAGYEQLKEAYAELEELKGKDLGTVNVIDPGNKRANAYMVIKDTGRALLSYQWMNMHRPGGLQGFVNIAKLYTDIGEYKKAEQNYLIAIKNSQGHHTDPYQGIFDLYQYHLKDDLDKFEPIIKKAISQTPDQPNFYLILAQYYELKGLTGDAITQYQKILELEPNNPTIRQKIAELSK